jgi:hypothetical protein
MADTRPLRTCPPPFSVAVDDPTRATNIFRYKSNAIVDAGRGTITLQPQCIANHKNMCPDLLSGGASCLTNGTCTFDYSNCTTGVQPEGVCVYKMDLLRDMRDVSYLLRSSGSTNNAQVPINMASALIGNLTARLEGMDRSEAVKFGMQADAWCLGPRRKTLEQIHLNDMGDYKTAKDRWGVTWSGIYWSQSEWLASIMAKPITREVGAKGNDCYVQLGCDVGSEWPNVLAELQNKLDLEARQA